MQKSCPFCSISSTESSFIKQFNYWTLLLHTNQSFLGRTILVLQSHKTDLAELEQNESQEMIEVIRLLRNIYKIELNAAKINYAVLGNELEHLHLHIIPRYASTVAFNNQLFEDQRFGQNPYPYDKNFKISANTLQKIKKIFHSKLV